MICEQLGSLPSLNIRPGRFINYGLMTAQDRVDFRQAPFPLNTQRARILGTIGAHVCLIPHEEFQPIVQG